MEVTPKGKVCWFPFQQTYGKRRLRAIKAGDTTTAPPKVFYFNKIGPDGKRVTSEVTWFEYGDENSSQHAGATELILEGHPRPDQIRVRDSMYAGNENNSIIERLAPLGLAAIEANCMTTEFWVDEVVEGSGWGCVDASFKTSLRESTKKREITNRDMLFDEEKEAHTRDSVYEDMLVSQQKNESHTKSNLELLATSIIQNSFIPRCSSPSDLSITGTLNGVTEREFPFRTTSGADITEEKDKDKTFHYLTTRNVSMESEESSSHDGLVEKNGELLDLNVETPLQALHKFASNSFEDLSRKSSWGSRKMTRGSNAEDDENPLQSLHRFASRSFEELSMKASGGISMMEDEILEIERGEPMFSIEVEAAHFEQAQAAVVQPEESEGPWESLRSLVDEIDYLHDIPERPEDEESYTTSDSDSNATSDSDSMVESSIGRRQKNLPLKASRSIGDLQDNASAQASFKKQAQSTLRNQAGENENTEMQRASENPLAGSTSNSAAIPTNKTSPSSPLVRKMPSLSFGRTMSEKVSRRIRSMTRTTKKEGLPHVSEEAFASDEKNDQNRVEREARDGYKEEKEKELSQLGSVPVVTSTRKQAPVDTTYYRPQSSTAPDSGFGIQRMDDSVPPPYSMISSNSMFEALHRGHNMAVESLPELSSMAASISKSRSNSMFEALDRGQNMAADALPEQAMTKSNSEVGAFHLALPMAADSAQSVSTHRGFFGESSLMQTQSKGVQRGHHSSEQQHQFENPLLMPPSNLPRVHSSFTTQTRGSGRIDVIHGPIRRSDVSISEDNTTSSTPRVIRSPRRNREYANQKDDDSHASFGDDSEIKTTAFLPYEVDDDASSVFSFDGSGNGDGLRCIDDWLSGS
jgi:hypothetical protein